MHCVRAWEAGECGSYLQPRIRQRRGAVANAVMNLLYYIKSGEVFKRQHAASQESLYFMELVDIHIQYHVLGSLGDVIVTNMIETYQLLILTITNGFINNINFFLCLSLSFAYSGIFSCTYNNVNPITIPACNP